WQDGDPKAHIDGDRLRGLGACDAKGSLAAMMLAVRHAAAHQPACNIALCAVVDEEYTFKGVQRRLESGFQADAAIVGEPTDQKVVVAHKGVLRFCIETQGRSGHASQPDKGKNAIVAMSRVVERLAGEYSASLAERVHPKLGPATINIGRIWSNTKANLVP